MERFFGGSPALVLTRLIILSLIVGVVLATLGLSPYDLVRTLQELIQRIYDMGFVAVEKAFRYFLLGAVVVFPIWVAMRVFKLFGQDDADLGAMAPANHEARTAKEPSKPAPAAGQ